MYEEYECLKWNGEYYLFNIKSSVGDLFAMKGNIQIKSINCKQATPKYDVELKRIFDEIV